jgi:hypothetical protein
MYFRIPSLLCRAHPPATAAMKPLPQLSDDEFTALVQRAVALPDAPPHLLQAALGAWQGSPMAAARLPGWGELASQAVAALRQQVAATLKFDSWAGAPLAAGLRGLRSDTRQLLFSAEGRDVDLRITASGERFAMAGQVLGPDEAGSVELSPVASPTDAPRVAALDRMGEFHLADLAPGRYQLTLHAGDTDIVLPAIQVGGDAA